MCGSPNTASIAAHLAASIPCRSGATVKHATWNSSMQQWQLAGVCGAHKDSVPAEARSEDFGSFDALVVSDAAVMRPGSAGYINFEASSQGGGFFGMLELVPMHRVLLPCARALHICFPLRAKLFAYL